MFKKRTGKWWTLATVCFALFMIILDGNVVNLAIPKIISSFGASLSQIEWVNNAYLLTFAILLITFGRLGDMYGRKKFFSYGIIAFVVGSMLCGLTQNTGQLIAARILQGLGGAAMMPATLSIISATFDKKERGMAMGVWGAMAGLGIIAGPILGGYLTDSGLGSTVNSFLHITENWRYVFYINVPFGILALLSTYLFIDESHDTESNHRLDIGGIILSGISIFALTFALIEGQNYGWWTATDTIPSLFGLSLKFGSLSVIPILFLIAAIVGTIFVVFENRVKVDPMMDIKIFKDRNFAVGATVAAILSFAMMGSFFLIPLFLQSVLGFSAIKTGQVLIPFAIGMIFAAPISGKLTDKLNGKWIAFVGLIVMAVGAYLLAHFRVDTTTAELVWPFLIMGVGMGMVNGPLSTITLLDVNPEEFGGASGVVGTTRQIGSVMGVAILGALLQAGLSANIATNINNVSGLSDEMKTRIIQVADESSGQSTSSDALRSELESIFAGQMTSQMSYSIPEGLTTEQSLAYQRQIIKTQESIIAKYKTIGEDITLAIKQAFTDAINNTLRISSYIALFGALISLLLHGKKAKSKNDPTKVEAII